MSNSRRNRKKAFKSSLGISAAWPAGRRPSKARIKQLAAQAGKK